MNKQLTAKELADLLNGRQYMKEITDEEEAAAKGSSLVVVFGFADDYVELFGAIHDELETQGSARFSLTPYGYGSCPIEAVWCAPDIGIEWTFKTDIPHEKFNVYKGEDLFCVGIVFSLEDVK